MIRITDSLIAAVFSLVCYQDGSLWRSGLCAGVAICLLVDGINSVFNERKSRENDHQNRS
jgi:hypothetical protein